MIITGSMGSTVVQRSNYGVLFKPVGQIQSVYDYWPHTFQIQLPEEIHPKPFNHTCGAQTHFEIRSASRIDHGCSLSQRAVVEYDRLRQEAADNLNQILQDIKYLLNHAHVNKNSDFRSKRSLIPFFFWGKLSKSQVQK